MALRAQAPARVAAWALLGLTACAEAPSDDTPPAASPLDGGWIDGVAAEPQRFGQLLERRGRDGWVAMHQGDYAAAAARLAAGPAAARAHLELALVHEDLGRVGGVAWPLLLARWSEVDPSVAAGALPMLAAMAQVDAGLERTVQLDSLQATWVAAVREPAAIEAVPKLADEEAGACLLAQLRLRAGAEPALPAACADGSPLVREERRVLYDPLLHGTHAVLHRRQAEQAAGGPLAPALATGGDEVLVLGSWWSQADLAADLAADPALAAPGAAGPTWAALELPEPGEADDPQRARERARALDVHLDAWRQARLDAASEDGRALLVDLDLVAYARSRALVGWARQALAEGRPHQATAWLQLAHDVEHSGTIGPRNPPALYALMAEAALRTGRTREALDALRALHEAYPQVEGLDETIGDLAVLEGMGRHGDSKEH